MPDLVLTERENNGAFEVRVGDRIAINLKENRSTAYMWQPAAEAKQQILVLVGDDYSLTGKATPGSGGIRTLCYRAGASGRVTIELQKRREWEPASFIERFKITVTVTSN